MSTRHDDPKFHRDCHWYNGAAEARRRTDGEYRRWPVLLILVACLIALAMRAEAGGTVTDSKYIWLQRSGVTLTDKTTPKLACPPPKTMLECSACMVEMIDAEVRRRTSGYVTYRCMDVSQSYVKFNTTPLPPVIPPPQASLQVYTCTDAGADGRILESATITWPNCQSASYKAPSRSLVVATNDGPQPLYWRHASKVTDSRIWTQTGTEGAWVRATSINWGTMPTPILGTANIRWTPPTQKVDGTPLDNLAGYKIVYGTSASAMTNIIDIKNPTATSHVIENLPPATYYFAPKAYNTDGTESGLGPIVARAIP